MRLRDPRGSGVLSSTFKYWSLAPAVLVLAAMTVLPALALLRMSVSTITFANGRELWAFTPGRNFAALTSDPGLTATIVNTLLFVVVAVAIEMAAGLALALLVGGLTRGKGLMRTILIVPILVPPVAIGNMFKLMYNYDFGLFNQVLGALGVPAVSWLGSTSLALWSIVLVDVWHWVPFVFLILFAAVEALPVDVLEAAHVDGANRWQMLVRIKLPLLKPALVVALLFRSILAFKAFDEVYLLTGGGPGTSSELVSLHLYRVFFEQNQLGYGALLSVLTIVVVLSLLGAGRRFVVAATP
ncbi:MAG TPA: sugar ABC transporter permease [Casimicrobiaceae bacterium]|nr:sugar ABC transporter permease [Casimicrobiaceae bacterium]